LHKKTIFRFVLCIYIGIPGSGIYADNSFQVFFYGQVFRFIQVTGFCPECPEILFWKCGFNGPRNSQNVDSLFIFKGQKSITHIPRTKNPDDDEQEYFSE